jgi:DNA mismatch endonuclease (patch repair protein)
MSQIRSSGNRDTELRMIKLFRANRIRGWRRKQQIFGKPDFVFRRERIAVFVDGCFWHGCPNQTHSPLPKNRAQWWAEKLRRNKKRDRVVTRKLRTQGWHVIRVWECSLTSKNLARTAETLVRRICVAGSLAIACLGGDSRNRKNKTGRTKADKWRKP